MEKLTVEAAKEEAEKARRAESGSIGVFWLSRVALLACQLVGFEEKPKRKTPSLNIWGSMPLV